VSAQIIQFPVRGGWRWSRVEPGWWIGRGPVENEEPNGTVRLEQATVVAHRIRRAFWVFSVNDSRWWKQKRTLSEIQQVCHRGMLRTLTRSQDL
jgi:hypothetical protein